MITSVRKNSGLISAKPILISSEICLEITTKSAVFYRLLFGEICPENFDKITPKSTNFSTNLSLKIRRNLTLSSATCQKRQPCQKILYKKPFHLMAVTKISSCWVYAILYKGKVLFILFFPFLRKQPGVMLIEAGENLLFRAFSDSPAFYRQCLV